MRARRWVVPLAVVSLACGSAHAQSTARPVVAQLSEDSEPQPAPPWPRVITAGTKTLTIHEPQAERWDEQRAVGDLGGFSARTPRPAGRSTAWCISRLSTDVDKTQQLVSLHDVQITGAEFPADPNQANFYRKTIDDSGQLTSVIAVESLAGGPQDDRGRA